MSDNLLKNAIAEARVIHQAALANARMSLEETFKPQLSSLLSARLRAELNESMNPGSSGIGTGLTVDNPSPKKPSADTSDSSNIENSGLEVTSADDIFDTPLMREAFGEEEVPGEEGDVDPTAPGAPAQGGAPAPAPAAPVAAGAPASAPVAAGAPGADMGGAPGATNPMGGEMGAGMEGGSPALDLDAIIRELELDVQNSAQSVDPTAGVAAPQPGSPSPTTQLESFQDVDAGEKPEGAFDGSLTEDAEGVFSDGKSPKAVDGVNGGKKVNPGTSVTDFDKDHKTVSGLNEEWELDEILREMEASDDAEVTSEVIATENVELKRSLREHRDVIVKLQKALQEVNLLNSKLLFTNKIFKAYDLNVGQKVRVVETLDRATTVREVKLIYATLAENFNGKIVTATTVKKAASITEGMASKPVGSTKPKSTQILAEGNDLVARMQKLAGINKK